MDSVSPATDRVMVSAPLISEMPFNAAEANPSDNDMINEGIPDVNPIPSEPCTSNEALAPVLASLGSQPADVPPVCYGNVVIQGVLMLNTVLTVREHQANSHAKKGWEQFTDEVIKTISQKKSGLVFLLWGNSAQSKTRLIDETKHHILKSAHPSGLSANRGFFGCRHFSKTNEILEKLGLSAIDWQL
ncbi:Uracil-DNA glycosylase mitochondrial [Zea mays]|uniref:Uracil-DNA glycosylase mitochondrial n=1 Tax=Zea mays TaxID=4577 RepID=A0A1D6DTQ7_MAIZE|nr:Uracil-DNA glycosylase mitochondrial [Zea mays]